MSRSCVLSYHVALLVRMVSRHGELNPLLEPGEKILYKLLKFVIGMKYTTITITVPDEAITHNAYMDSFESYFKKICKKAVYQ